jgi:hypothetical protein
LWVFCFLMNCFEGMLLICSLSLYNNSFVPFG